MSADPQAQRVAAPPWPPADAAPQPLSVRLRLWRNRMIGSPGFRRWMLRLPFTRKIAQRRANDLFRLTAGFVFSQVLGACLSLGVFARLKDTTAGSEALARDCGLPVARMRLLLDQAARLGLVRRAGPDDWVLDDAGAVVAADPGIAAMIEHHSLFYRDLTDPAALFRDPQPATALNTYWAYGRGHDVAALDPEAAAAYSRLMRASQAMLSDCILDAHDFGRYEGLLDVGGGEGAFLAAAAARHPRLRLQLFDLPPVAELARRHLGGLGLLHRADLAGGDFVATPIPTTSDCVSLVRVLCDHDDDRVRQILSNLHRSMRPGATLVVAEAMAGASEGAQLAAVYFGLYFLAMGSGRCRSESEIRRLVTEAGFRNARTRQTSAPLLATLVLATR
ncbi:methyltransferase domain-containing protein [Microvirga tunisiensis]|uniref:Methyltransferase domain-containing protein n=1 Tax=Pannonibacter tanglangensis TaxID=2750084 RepID=A0A7X5J7Z8_9HYPH|nr:methyltransferase [Pannonibacter sp. XCT-53]NBN76695.1 methyltransferase domain-containing protein [Pannonibacter sp. XCT-53]